MELHLRLWKKNYCQNGSIKLWSYAKLWMQKQGNALYIRNGYNTWDVCGKNIRRLERDETTLWKPK